MFLRRGFHGASLDEIADEAGYTKGAVYSNFAGKDDLFLALLDAHYDRRIDAYVGLMLEEPSFEDAIRAVGRFMVDADARDPDWLPTLAEFVAHAARDEALRRAYVAVRERFLVAIADVIAALVERHGLRASRAVARGRPRVVRHRRAATAPSASSIPTRCRPRPSSSSTQRSCVGSRFRLERSHP